MRRHFYLAICLAAVVIGACSTDSNFPVATGKGRIGAINAIATSSDFAVLIEERSIGVATYKGMAGPASYDDLEYDFNFEVSLDGVSAPTRVATQHLDVMADMVYVFIISGAVANPTMTLWEFAEREFTDTDTVFEARFGHTSESLGNVDVYFAAPGIAPALGAEMGTLAFGGILPVADFTAGDFVITFTAAGDPTTVLFTSGTIGFNAGTTWLLSVFDADANDLAPLSVSRFNPLSGVGIPVPDANFDPTLRFFHASLGLGTADIYIEDPLVAALVTDHAFGDFTGDIAVTAGTIPLTYTTALNTGSILIDTDVTVAAGTHNHYYAIRDSAGADTLLSYRPNRRSIGTVARLGIINTSTNYPAIDLYVVTAGTGIADASPALSNLAFGSAPTQHLVAAGSFDLYLTTPGEKTELAGPIPLNTALGDVIDTIIYDKVDPAFVDLVFIPLP